MGNSQSSDQDSRIPFSNNPTDDLPVKISDRLLAKISEQIPDENENDQEIQDSEPEEPYEDPNDINVIKRKIEEERVNLEEELETRQKDREMKTQKERDVETDIYSNINQKIQQSQNLLFIDKLKEHPCKSMDEQLKECLSQNSNNIEKCQEFKKLFDQCLKDL
ncbi:hypothetical protein WA158_003643 [Blastocystis sp. Blastoise]